MDLRNAHIYVTSLYFVLQRDLTEAANEQKTWMEALKSCHAKESFVDNDEQALTNYLDSHPDVDSLWVGQYSGVLPWIEIRGCYFVEEMDGRPEIDLDGSFDSTETECQIKCMPSMFFGIHEKTSRCVCFNDSSIVEATLNASGCFDEPDNNFYVIVFKVLNMEEVQISSRPGNNGHCVTAECNDLGTLSYNAQNCTQYFKSYCRNRIIVGNELGYTDFWKTVNGCIGNGTFPLHSSENLCGEFNSTGMQYWVGIKGHEVNLQQLDRNEFEILNRFVTITDCFYIDKNLDVKLSKCVPTDKHMFICRSDSDGISSLPENRVTNDESNESFTGVVVGIALAVVVAGISIVVCIILYRRRVSTKPVKPDTSNPETKPSDNNNKTTNTNGLSSLYYEIDHEFPNDLQDIHLTEIGNDTTLDTYNSLNAQDDFKQSSRSTALYSHCIFANQKESSEDLYDSTTDTVRDNPNYTHFNETASDVSQSAVEGKIEQKQNDLFIGNLNTSKYSLQKPIGDDVEINSCDENNYDPYAENTEYDCLHYTKRKDANGKQNVYNNLSATLRGDTTYDHSNISSPKSTEDNYDHFTVDRNVSM